MATLCEECECNLRVLVERWITKARLALREVQYRLLTRPTFKLKLAYVKLFGTVYDKLRLELHQSLVAHVTAPCIAPFIKELPAETELLNESSRVATGLCILEHGEDVVAVYNCTRRKMLEYSRYAETISTVLLIGTVLEKYLKALESLRGKYENRERDT